MAVAEEKGVGTEGQRWGARVSQILKTRDRRLEGFLCFGVVVVAGTSTQVVVWLEDAQESVARAMVVEHMSFLVARSGYSDCPLAQSSQLPDRVPAAECTDADNDEGSSVAGWYNAALGRLVVGRRSPLQSLRRETRRLLSPIYAVELQGHLH